MQPERERPGLLIPQRPDDSRAAARQPTDIFVPSHVGRATALDLAVTALQRQHTLAEEPGGHDGRCRCCSARQAAQAQDLGCRNVPRRQGLAGEAARSASSAPGMEMVLSPVHAVSATERMGSDCSLTEEQQTWFAKQLIRVSGCGEIVV